MSLTWEEFKAAVTQCPTTDRFTARQSTITGDDAVFITEKPRTGPFGGETFMAQSTTFRINQNTYMNLLRNEPEYLQLLQECRLRGFDAGRGIRIGGEKAEGFGKPFALGLGAILALALVVALK